VDGVLTPKDPFNRSSNETQVFASSGLDREQVFRSSTLREISEADVLDHTSNSPETRARNCAQIRFHSSRLGVRNAESRTLTNNARFLSAADSGRDLEVRTLPKPRRQDNRERRDVRGSTADSIVGGWRCWVRIAPNGGDPGGISVERLRCA